MNTAMKRSGTIAATAALLGGGGLVAASAPVNAAAPLAVEAASAPTRAVTHVKSAGTAVIVYKSGAVSAKASIRSAPQVAPAKKKKKAKKKYKSRRS
jgi:hypothetical protein